MTMLGCGFAGGLFPGGDRFHGVNLCHPEDNRYVKQVTESVGKSRLHISHYYQQPRLLFSPFVCACEI